MVIVMNRNACIIYVVICSLCINIVSSTADTDILQDEMVWNDDSDQDTVDVIAYINAPLKPVIWTSANVVSNIYESQLGDIRTTQSRKKDSDVESETTSEYVSETTSEYVSETTIAINRLNTEMSVITTTSSSMNTTVAQKRMSGEIATSSLYTIQTTNNSNATLTYTSNMNPDDYTWTINTIESYGTNVAALFNMGITGKGQSVAVLDSGISAQVALYNVVRGYDFVSDPLISNDGDGRDPDPTETYDAANNCLQSSFHGTKVASIIKGAPHSVAPDVSIYMMRVLGICGKGYAADVSDAIEWTTGGVINGMQNIRTPVKLLSLSFTGKGACPNYLQTAITHAVSRNAMIVVSAGNNAADASSYFPCNCKGVFVVGASTRNGAFASFSNYGALLNISAPGVSVPVLQYNNIVTLGSGTSFAAPHVAAMMALGVPLFSQPLSTPCPYGSGVAVGDDWCGNGIISINLLEENIQVQHEITVTTSNLVLMSTGCTGTVINGYYDTSDSTCLTIGCNAGYENVASTSSVCSVCPKGKFKSLSSIYRCAPESVPGPQTVAGQSLYCGVGLFYVRSTTTSDAVCLPCTLNPAYASWVQYAANINYTLASSYCNWRCDVGYFNFNKTRY